MLSGMNRSNGNIINLTDPIADIIVRIITDDYEP